MRGWFHINDLIKAGNMKVSYQIKIFGRVQGVNFRNSAKTVADRLNVAGVISNMPDGSVKVRATGEQQDINEFINWCHKGPPVAHVENVKVEEIPLQNDTGFRVQ